MIHSITVALIKPSRLYSGMGWVVTNNCHVAWLTHLPPPILQHMYNNNFLIVTTTLSLVCQQHLLRLCVLLQTQG